MPARGVSQNSYWAAQCKDCEAEMRSARGLEKEDGSNPTPFQYSDASATREQDLGRIKSDRCPRHRKAHREAIRALAVPYIDLDVIGKVRDRNNPTGPLGGLGPLLPEHIKGTVSSDLAAQDFGMTDDDILNILEGLRTRRVAVIEAGTGSGKSTFMPFRLMNPPPGASFFPLKSGAIVVTEPRRAAAISVANFVGNCLCFGLDPMQCAPNQCVGPGFPVGYQVSGDRNWDRACDLRYVTDGTMINWIRDGSLAKLGMVIIDEAHERSTNIDVILTQLKGKLDEHPNLRVIITSATIDRDLFINYFGGPEHVFHYDVPGKKSFGYGVPLFIDLETDDQSFEHGLSFDVNSESIVFLPASGQVPARDGCPAYDLAEATRSFATLRCVGEIPVERWPNEMPKAVARQVLAIAEGTEWGDILAFLPTERTINASIKMIAEGLQKIGGNFDVYPLLRSTDKKTTTRATEARRIGAKRRIVVSSNLAETSLTVSGIRFIVDSGLICQSEWDPSIASGSMPIKPHSKAGVRQRWGRVGRDAPGTVFPLYTQKQFLALGNDTPAESSRTNLEAFLTRLAAAGIEPSPGLLPAGFDHPDLVLDEAGQKDRNVFIREVERAKRSLSISGLVDADGDLTRAGKEVEKYPGEASTAYAIALGDQLACSHEVALALAALGKNVLYGKKSDCILRLSPDWPDEWCARAAVCHSVLARGCSDDLDLVIRIAAGYQRAFDREEWCSTWWINEAALNAVLDEAENTILGLSAAMKSDAMRAFDERLSYRARAVLSRAFASTRYQRAGNGRYRSIEEPDLPAARLGAVSYGEESEFRIFFQRFKIDDFRGRDDVPPRLILGHFVNFLPEAIGNDRDGLGFFDLVVVASRLRMATDQLGTGVADPFTQLRHRVPIGSILRLTLAERVDCYFDIEAGQIISLPFLAPSSEWEPNENDPGFDREWDPRGGVGDEANDEPALTNLREVENNEDWLDDVGAANPLNYEAQIAMPTDAAFSSWPKMRISVPPKYLDDVISLFQPKPGETMKQGRVESDGQNEQLPDSALLPANSLWIVSDYEMDGGETVLIVDPCDENKKSIDPSNRTTDQFLDSINVICCGEIAARETKYLKFWQKGSFRFFYVAKPLATNIILFGETDATFTFPDSAFSANVIERKITEKTDRSQVTLSFGPSLLSAMASMPTTLISVWGTKRRFARAQICEVLEAEDKIIAQLEDELSPFGFRPRVSFPTAWTGDNSGIAPICGEKILVSFELSPQSKQTLVATDPKLKNFVSSRSHIFELADDETLTLLAPIDINTARTMSGFGSGARWRQTVSFLFDRSHSVRATTVWTTKEKSAQYRDIFRSELLQVIDDYEDLDQDDWENFGEKDLSDRIFNLKEAAIGRSRALIDEDRQFCFDAAGRVKRLIKNRINLSSKVEYRDVLCLRIAKIQEDIDKSTSYTFREKAAGWLEKAEGQAANNDMWIDRLGNWIDEDELFVGT